MLYRKYFDDNQTQREFFDSIAGQCSNRTMSADDGGLFVEYQRGLTIEVNPNFKKDNTEFTSKSGVQVSITPPIDDQYYIARVVIYRDQAINIFPKFFIIGCGFAQEEDWNTNLPISCDAEEIYDHIKHNKKYSCITKKQCIEAISALQDFVKENKLLSSDSGQLSSFALPMAVAAIALYLMHFMAAHGIFAAFSVLGGR